MYRPGRSYSDVAINHRGWLVVGLVIILLSIIGGVGLGPSIPGTIQQQIWRTLAGVQAAIVAIVFSVLFIATQLTSDRYSPYYVGLFVNDPLVMFPFLVGFSALILDILVFALSSAIYTTLSPSGGLFWGIGGFVFGLNILFLVWLYPLIRIILVYTSPSNALEQLHRLYDAERFIEEAVEASGDGDKSRHSFQSLFDYIRNSLNRNNLAVASAGTASLFSISSEFVNDVPESSVALPEDVDEKELPEILFGPVLNEYTLDIVAIAHSQDLAQVGVKAVYGVGDVCESAVEASWPQPMYIGLNVLISEFIEEMGESDRSEITPKIVGAATEVCFDSLCVTTQALEEFENLLPQFAGIIDTIANLRNVQELMTNTALRKVGEGCVDVHNSLLQEHPERYSTDEHFQLEGRLIGFDTTTDAWTPSSDSPKRSELFSCISLLSHASAVGFIERDNGAEGLLAQLSNNWQKVIEQSLEQSAQVHSILVIRRYLEFMSEVELRYGIEGPSIGFRLRQITDDECDRAVVEAAFDSIMTEHRTGAEMRRYTFSDRSVVEISNPVPVCEYSDERQEIFRNFRDSYYSD